MTTPTGPELASIMQMVSLAMSPLIAQQNQFMESVLKTLKPQSTGLFDTRGIGRPPKFGGKDEQWRQWRGKLTAFLYASDLGAEKAMKWVERQTHPITETVMELSCTSDDGLIDDEQLRTGQIFSSKFYLMLSDTCEGEAYRLVESAGPGNGLEAWRVLLRRYASKTPGTKRALLQNLFNTKQPTSTDSFESLLLTIEEQLKRYDDMAEARMPDDIRCAILVHCCPKDLKEHFEMSSEEFVYTELRAKMNTWVERKRDQQPRNLQKMENNMHGPTPMDVSAAAASWDEWWSPSEDWSPYEWPCDDRSDGSISVVQDWGGYPGNAYESTWSALMTCSWPTCQKAKARAKPRERASPCPRGRSPIGTRGGLAKVSRRAKAPPLPKALAKERAHLLGSAFGVASGATQPASASRRTRT